MCCLAVLNKLRRSKLPPGSGTGYGSGIDLGIMNPPRRVWTTETAALPGRPGLTASSW